MAPKSLIATSRERYLNTIRSVQPSTRWKILVVDNFVRQHLNSLLKLDTILRENVTLVENLENGNREAQPNYEAAYFVTPTSSNIERIIRDLTPDHATGSTRYSAGHVFFVDALSDTLLQRLTSSPAEPRLRQVIELYNNFWALESQVFSLKTPESFFTIFQPPGGAWGVDSAEALKGIEEELQFSVQTLLNVCVSLNEFPLIRYYNPSHPPLGPLANQQGESSGTIPAPAPTSAYASSMRMARLRAGGDSSAAGRPGAASGPDHFTRKLALRLQEAIDDYVADNQPKPDSTRPRGVLFITDRTMDTVSPFLHEFSYQAMVADLLPLEEDGTVYSYKFLNAVGQKEDRRARLSDEESVWRAIRHLHIAEAIDRLTKDFTQHAGTAAAHQNSSSLHDMRDMLATLPEMQETKEALSLHLTMAQECMNIFERSRLPQQAMVEQNCATRTTPDGAKPRTLVEDMVPLLDDREISNADKVRIIALYIMYSEGVPDEDRKRLFQHARLGLHEMDAVDNLVHLGARVLKDPQNSGWDAWFKKGKRRQAPGENEYELSRYQPLVKLMLEDHFAGRLDQTTYPYVKDAPPDFASASSLSAASTGGLGSLRDAASAISRGASPALTGNAAAPRGPPTSLRSAKPTWAQKGRGGGHSGGSSNHAERADITRQRVLVFVAGGMTYSEVRSAYQVSDRLAKDVYIGSSHIFTPASFLDSLKRFGKASGAGAHHHQGAGQHHSGGRSGLASGLPTGANQFSKPDNDASGLRSSAAAARSGRGGSRQYADYGDGAPQQGYGGGRNGHSASVPAQRFEADQGAYERRYGGGAAPAPHDTTNHGYGQSSAQSNHSSASRPQASRAPQTYGPSSSASLYNSHHQASGAVSTSGHGSADGRSLSPAPSATYSIQSNPVGAAGKEKKRLKNLFSSKK
ncbi:sec1-like protein [Ceraceosorus bombacis]|uniref:Sec1-like protein n=1 Tax=Ceraceosorus bombacis TaxID=401625 RepID=A0A0P1BMM0_9BASI|nr:sec1-like protein [Ceraceosorus bombacis]